MIQVIAGKKGSGKTKRILDMANNSVKDSRHDIIFIDDDNRYMFDLRHEVRFVNASEYGVAGADQFIGFLCGILAANFDVGQIYIDAFLKLVNCDLAEMESFFARLDVLSHRHNMDFVLSVSADIDTLPEFVKQYLL